MTEKRFPIAGDIIKLNMGACLLSERGRDLSSLGGQIIDECTSEQLALVLEINDDIYHSYGHKYKKARVLSANAATGWCWIDRRWVL